MRIMDEKVMALPKEYFLDEVREGFFIPSMMKRSWAAIFSNYKDLEQFCDEYGMDCFVVWGTLLGAIRHGGFVPWDDDVDVAMLREHYRTLKDMADHSELSGEHCIDDYQTGDIDNTKSRWLSSRNIVRTQEESAENYGFPFINIIDIDVLDDIPSSGKERELFVKIVEVIVQLRDKVRMLSNPEDMTEAEIEAQKDEVAGQIHRISEIVGYEYDDDDEVIIQLMRMLELYSEKTSRAGSHEVSILSYFMKNNKFIFPKRYLKDSISVDFEFDTIKVPIGYDRFLRTCWPDYAVPVIDYDSHIYPYYRGMEEELRENYGFEFMTYHLYPEQYENVTGSRQEKLSLKEFVRSSLELLKEAHVFLEACVSKGADGLDDEFFGVLGECQNLAVSIGDKVEKRMLPVSVTGESDRPGLSAKRSVEECISLLESYCEDVYAAYQKELSVSAEDIGKLRSYEAVFDGTFSEINEKAEVVFLCYMTEHWKSLHTIWESAMADENVHVTVIAVPYYLKENDGSIDKDEMITEDAGYPPEVELTP